MHMPIPFPPSPPTIQLDDKTREFEDKKQLLDTANKELADARTKITALMIVQEGTKMLGFGEIMVLPGGMGVCSGWMTVQGGRSMQ